jgi:hypothetical protein
MFKFLAEVLKKHDGFTLQVFTNRGWETHMSLRGADECGLVGEGLPLVGQEHQENHDVGKTILVPWTSIDRIVFLP